MIKVTGAPGAAGSLSSWAAKEALEDILSQYGVGDALELRLITDGPTPNSAQVWADCTEATFAGYAALTGLEFSPTAFEDGRATAICLEPDPVFTATDAVTPNNIIGWALTKQDGSTKLVYLELFDEPVAMDQAGAQLTVPPLMFLKLTP